jgi:hypothetical protein
MRIVLEVLRCSWTSRKGGLATIVIAVIAIAAIVMLAMTSSMSTFVLNLTRLMSVMIRGFGGMSSMNL